MTDYALRLLNDVDTAQRVRLHDTHRATPAGPLAVRGGLRPDGGGVVSVVPSSMNVKLTRFSADVPGTSTAQGGYGFVHDDPNTTYAIDPGAVGDRIDLLVARVRANAFDGSGATDAAVVVVKGDPTTGLPPSVPAGSTPLWELNVTSTASSGTGGLTVGTDRRLYSVGAGGVLPVASTTERDALASPASGLVVFNKATGLFEGYNGTIWKPIAFDTDTDTGWVDATLTSGYETQAGRQAKSRVINNRVHLDGLITKSSGSFSASASTTIATLAVGHRPPDTKRMSAGGSATVAVNVSIQSTGEVSIVTSASVPTYISLDGLSFLTS